MKIVEGMGQFWKKVGPDSFDGIYNFTLPTSENLINVLEAEEKGNVDQKLTTWLHRFIRSCQFEDLLRFARFVTGTHSVFPDQVISCLLYTSPSPRDGLLSRMPSSA